MRLLSVVWLFLVIVVLAQAGAAVQALPGAKAVFLIAKPQVKGPFFRRSVVLVTPHGKGATIGLILNRPTDIQLTRPGGDPLPPSAANPMVFVGGPVDRHHTVFLVRSSTPIAAGLELVEGVYMSESSEVLDEALTTGLPKTELRVFKGYSSWVKGQLAREIKRDDWLVVPAQADLIFAEPEGLWERLMMEHRGGRWVDAPDSLAAENG